MSAESISTPNNEADLFQALEAYGWQDDPEFQTGLDTIIPADASTEQVREITQRAKCFFFSRKTNTPIDFNTYLTWLSKQGSLPPPPALVPASPIAENTPRLEVLPAAPSTSTAPLPAKSLGEKEVATAPDGTDEKAKAPYPMSFDRIVELITTGQPIPGIKQIPNTLNADTPSVSEKPIRRKPWEVAAEKSAGTNVEGAD